MDQARKTSPANVSTIQEIIGRNKHFLTLHPAGNLATIVQTLLLLFCHYLWDLRSFASYCTTHKALLLRISEGTQMQYYI